MPCCLSGPVLIHTQPIDNQLCNQLVLSSHLYAWALEHDATVISPHGHAYCEQFPNLRRSRIGRLPPSRRDPMPYPRVRFWRRCTSKVIRNTVKESLVRRWPLNGRYRVNRSADTRTVLDDPAFVESTQGCRVIALEGWHVIAPSLVEKHYAAVRDFDAVDPGIQQRVEAYLRPLRERCDTLIGVHIRRGDYIMHRGGQYYFEDDVYDRACDVVARRAGQQRVGFVFCSQGPVAEPLLADRDAVTGPGSAIEDMLALSGCDTIVGPPSTFSVWAAFIGNAELLVMSSAQEDPSPRPRRMIERLEPY